MTDTLVGVSPLRKTAKKTLTPEEVERNAVGELVKAARARGDDLTGPDGLLKVITKQVIEAALEEEMTEHVGYDKHAAQGRNGANSRNGTRVKTVLTDNAGPVEIDVPRDRDGSFEPLDSTTAIQNALAEAPGLTLNPVMNAALAASVVCRPMVCGT